MQNVTVYPQSAALAALADGPIKADYQPLPAHPDGQVFDTIDYMRRYVMEDSQFPLIVETAQQLLTLHVQTGESLAQLIHDRANEVLDFTLDADVASVNGLSRQDEIVEVLTRPADVEILFRRGGGAKVKGDCDDFSMYVLALAQALSNLGSAAYGSKIDNLRFVTIAAIEGSDNFSHVYTRVNVNDKTTAIDASHGPTAGWEASNRATRLVEHPVGAQMGLIQAAGLVAVGFILWGLLKGNG